MNVWNFEDQPSKPVFTVPTPHPSEELSSKMLVSKSGKFFYVLNEKLSKREGNADVLTFDRKCFNLRVYEVKKNNKFEERTLLSAERLKSLYLNVKIDLIWCDQDFLLIQGPYIRETTLISCNIGEPFR